MPFGDTLVGLLFLNPLAGLLIGAAAGAGAGALSGALADYGIDDDFIKSLGEQIGPDTSALFVLLRKVTYRQGAAGTRQVRRPGDEDVAVQRAGAEAARRDLASSCRRHRHRDRR